MDTNIFIDEIRGKRTYLSKLISSLIPLDLELITPTIVLFELYVGEEMEDRKKRQRVEKLVGATTLIPFDGKLAKFSGDLLRQNRALSSLLTIDLIVGATAVHLNAELATHDRKHFKGIPDLKFFDFKRL